jgi:hypothetical protein
MSVRACPPRQRARAGGSAGSNYTPPYQTTCIQVVQCTGRGASNNCGFAREKRGSGMPHHTCSRQAGRTTWLPPPRVLRRCLFRPTDRMKMNPPHDTIGECVRVASEQLRPNGGWERTVAGARAGIFASTLVHCLVGYPASSPPKTSPFVERRQCQTNTRLAGPTKHSREMPGTVPNPGGAGHAVVGGVQFRWLQLRATRTCIPRIENNGKRSHACIARLSYLCYVDDDGETASATTMMSSFCFFFTLSLLAYNTISYPPALSASFPVLLNSRHLN